ncbi:hypothetical protein [Desulfosporosinus sp. BICA1-9]|uniref:hypothetical protein n=1 Tax=Desulfosporosinus sp. BICA1-9 TaxID=1531958 RepID=UPI0025B9E4D3|nr:hypothetical protein [Desulfosporosinus sp. BICA1-9]
MKIATLPTINTAIKNSLKKSKKIPLSNEKSKLCSYNEIKNKPTKLVKVSGLQNMKKVAIKPRLGKILVEDVIGVLGLVNKIISLGIFNQNYSSGNYRKYPLFYKVHSVPHT